MTWAVEGSIPEASGWSLPRRRIEQRLRLLALSTRSPGLSRRARRRRRGQRKAILKELERSR